MALASCHGTLVSCFVLVFVIYEFTLHVIGSATMQGSSGFRMKLIPIYSEHSPMNPGNLNDEQRYGLILQLSRARSFRLSSKLTGGANLSTAYPDVISPVVKPALDAFYIVEVGIGDRRQRVFLHFDTGSNLIWVQCEHCVRCFPLRYASYEYFKSGAFQLVKCNTPHCVPDICNNDFNCEYNQDYGDGSSSDGLLAWDDFSFFSQDAGGVETVRRLLFGCGFAQNIGFGRNTGANNVIAGMLGMAKGEKSLVSQLGQQALGRFSYCLTHWTQQGSVSHLKFGAQASFPPTANMVHTTPFKIPDTEHYILNLLDIHVNDVSIGSPRGSLGATLLDTGAPMTDIPPLHYDLLKLEVNRHFRRNNLRLERYDASSDPNFSLMKFCFRKPSPDFDLYPKITFKFEGGADFTPTNRGAFAIFDDFFCMQIQDTQNGHIPIMGAFIQTDHIFVHDIRQQQLSFARVADCSGV